MSRIFPILLSLCAVLSAQAADVLHLDLPRAIEMALARNFQLEVSAYDPAIAQAHITQQWGRFDPTFNLRYTRGEDNNRFGVLSPLDGSLSSLISQSDEASAGITGLLPWGMRYNAGIDVINQRGTANGFLDVYTATPTIGATQPLLRDFGFSANLAQVRIARTDARASQWAYRQRIIDVITQVSFVYNELNFAMQDLGVAEESRALALQVLRDNQRRSEIGVMSPLDVTTARAEYAAREEGVILARRAVRDNENFLKQLITDDIDALLPTRLSIVRPPSPEHLAVNVQQGIRDALTWRPDYRQALLDIQRQRITLAFERNQALPRLDLTGSLDLIGFDSGVTASTANALNGNHTSWTAGAIFSVPIPNREGRARVNAAQLGKAQLLVELKRLEQDIVVKVDNAAGQIVTNQQRITSTAESSRLARESLDAGEQRLRAGTGTTFEVLELQKKLAEAEGAELRARSDYNKAISEYDRQTGLTLDHNGVTLDSE